MFSWPRPTSVQVARGACRIPVGTLLLALSMVMLVATSVSAAVTGLTAERIGGQIFLTWNESGAQSYDIYRSSQPISNISSLTAVHTAAQGSAIIPRLTNYDPQFKDGATPSMGAITRVCLRDFEQVQAGKGVFVRDCDESGNFYYAVLESGASNVIPGENSLLSGVAESVGLPPMFQISTYDNGLARMYMYYMDSASWDSDDGHFAYIQQVLLPDGFDPGREYPLWVSGHGWGDGGTRYNIATTNGGIYDWQVVRIMIDDFRNTWYFGNKNLAGTHVGNYTEARVIQGIMAVIDDTDMRIDTDRVYVRGQSMGGSGAISMGMRYPNIFAACFASKGMTDYTPTQWGSNDWSNDVAPKWGTPADNLPLKIVGRWADHLKKYEGMPVYQWQEHQAQMIARRGDAMAYLVTTHGSSDTVIPWESQAVPWYPIARASGQGFAGYTNDSAHSGALWTGSPNFAYAEWGNTYSVWNQFVFRKDVSFPGVIEGTNNNHNVLWGCPWLTVNGVSQIIDEPDEWSLLLRSDNGTQLIGLVPRRLQRFEVVPGNHYEWKSTNQDGSVIYQSGVVTADEDGLMTIPAGSLEVNEGGRRLTVRPTGVPVAIRSFQGQRVENRVRLQWEIFGDLGEARLHVHREIGGGAREQLTTDPLGSEIASFEDLDAPQEQISYWLEDVGGGSSVWFGPAVVGAAFIGTQLSMAPPWPNPMSAQSQISYRTTQAGSVRLTIHDVRGRRVAVLVDETQIAGDHLEQWSGLDESGMPVSPGTYFAKVKTPEGTLSRKIQLIR